MTLATNIIQDSFLKRFMLWDPLVRCAVVYLQSHSQEA